MVACAFVYTSITPNRYTATAVLLVDPRQQTVLDTNDVLGGIGADSTAVESQIALLRSAAVSNALLREFAVASDPEYNKETAYVTSIVSPVDANEPRLVSMSDVGFNKAIAAFEKNLAVERRENTYILDVKFTSTDPVKAARIANAIADGYLRGQTAGKQLATRQAVDWIEARIGKLREQAQASEQAVADFKAEHSIIDLGSVNSGETFRKVEIDRSLENLNRARAETAKSESLYLEVKAAANDISKTETLPAVLQSPVISDLRIIYANLKRQEIRLSSTVGEKHPSLTTVREEIRSIQIQIADETKRVLAGAESDYKSALSNEQNLSEQLKAQQNELSGVNNLMIRLRTLESNAEVDKNLLQQFQVRLKETSEQVSLEKPDASVISSARVPIDPSSISALLVMVAALLAGIALATGWAVIANSKELDDVIS